MGEPSLPPIVPALAIFLAASGQQLRRFLFEFKRPLDGRV
jgi:hypothetical protein